MKLDRYTERPIVNDGTRRMLSWLGILVLLLALGGGFLWSQDLEARYRETADQLICQCDGCTSQLSVCSMQNCHSATPMRAEIREKLAQGQEVGEIVAAFVVQYGKKVLSAPTRKGFDLAAWVMPFFILGLGLLVVSWIAVKMRRPLPEEAPAAPAGYDARVERELQEFEGES